MKHKIVIDPNFKITDVTNGTVTALGLTSEFLIGLNFFDALPFFRGEDYKEIIEQVLDTGITKMDARQVIGSEGTISFYKYEFRPFIKNRVIVGVCVEIEEITEQKLKERQSDIQGKILLLARLSGNVAHEINNPLEAILNRIGTLLMDNFQQGGLTYLRSELGKLQDQVYRISATTTALTDFSNESVDNHKTVDLNAVLQKSIELCKLSRADGNTKISPQLENDLPRILGSDIDLEKCFVNIIINALEATGDGQRVEIITSRSKKGGNNILRVIDNGVGIPNENLDKIMEPFFTTKEKAKGLGLSISYGIVADHGGTIQVDSEMGKGTTVTISFPVIE